MRKVFLIWFVGYLLACNTPKKPYDGIWFLTNVESSSPSKYLEIEIQGDSSWLNSDGFYWYPAQVEFGSDGSVRLHDYHGKYVMPSENAIIIYDSLSRYHFQKLSSKMSGISNQDLDRLRKYKYYATSLTEKDSLLKDIILEEIWFYLRGEIVDTSKINDDIRIVPNY